MTERREIDVTYDLEVLSPDEVRAHREEWTRALESGDYSQSFGRLRDEEGFCCLGVVETLRGGDWHENDYGAWGVRNRRARFVDHAGEPLLRVAVGSDISYESSLLSTYGMHWLGVLTGDPHVVIWDDDEGWRTATLSSLNDDSGFTFSEIAAVVRDQAPDWNGLDETTQREVDRRVNGSVPRPKYAGTR